MGTGAKKKTVYVGMSGGVDSSVAAALLKKRDFNVVGVFMKPWQPEGGPGCLWKEDREDAMRAASVLGIPLLTWDFSGEYKKEVADYMISEYRAGRTPNPDVMCNKEIKFGLFFEKAMKEGADLIATGHYVRVAQAKSEKRKTKRYKLLMAKDKNKDQSYFLWTLKQRHLEKCLFPVGDYIKPEIRKLAKKFKLPNHAKKDSQGVCFIGPLDMKDFLANHIRPKKGKIICLDGRVLGEHDGAYYYTIGQRHGLDIKDGKGPYYVVSKNVTKNIVYVGKEKDLESKRLKVKNISWVGGKVKLPASLSVRLRYRAGLKKAVLKKDGPTGQNQLDLKTHERAITSGQSVVFYRGQEMLGGGIIL